MHTAQQLWDPQCGPLLTPLQVLAGYYPGLLVAFHCQLVQDNIPGCVCDALCDGAQHAHHIHRSQMRLGRQGFPKVFEELLYGSQVEMCRCDGLAWGLEVGCVSAET